MAVRRSTELASTTSVKEFRPCHFDACVISPISLELAAKGRSQGGRGPPLMPIRTYAANRVGNGAVGQCRSRQQLRAARAKQERERVEAHELLVARG